MEIGSKIPTKSRNLKIIDHLGTYYAAIGPSIWKLEKPIFNLLMECDGVRTVDEISQKLAKLVNVTPDEIKNGLAPIFEELEGKGILLMVQK